MYDANYAAEGFEEGLQPSKPPYVSDHVTRVYEGFMKEQQRYTCDTCGLVPALDVIGGKWKALILWEMNTRPRRFGQLKRLVPGISEKMLIQALRELETDGIVHREVFYEVPPRVEYSVTEFGASLNAALEPLCSWGARHMERIATIHQE